LGFTGFRAAADAFLRELGERQDRVWFAQAKPVYQREVMEPMSALVEDLSAELARRKIPLWGDPKRAIFRPYRDVRFSHDKRPFKPHCSAALTRDGVKMSPGVLYIHIDPTGSFVASGFHAPEKETLADLRGAMVADPARFRSVLARLKKSGLALDVDEDALKRLPRGFEAAPETLHDDLRRKNFVVRRPLAKAALRKPDIVGSIADFAAAAMPLLSFGWEAIDGPTPPHERA
jgi:uncharacterized protein (TIGR02453 family)